MLEIYSNKFSQYTVFIVLTSNFESLHLDVSVRDKQQEHLVAGTAQRIMVGFLTGKPWKELYIM
jgi:hypothetical protein